MRLKTYGLTRQSPVPSLGTWTMGTVQGRGRGSWRSVFLWSVVAGSGLAVILPASGDVDLLLGTTWRTSLASKMRRVAFLLLVCCGFLKNGELETKILSRVSGSMQWRNFLLFAIHIDCFPFWLEPRNSLSVAQLLCVKLWSSMVILFPLVVASEVFKYVDYQSLVVLTRATRTVRQTYEPLALEYVKRLLGFRVCLGF